MYGKGGPEFGSNAAPFFDASPVVPAHLNFTKGKRMKGKSTYDVEARVDKTIRLLFKIQMLCGVLIFTGFGLVRLFLLFLGNW